MKSASEEKPHLTILCPNLGGNCLGRALVLAECLKSRFRVRIVGPLKRGAQIWKVAQPSPEIEIVAVRFHRLPFYIFTIINILKNIKGEKIFASKPLMSSFGVGLLAKYFLKKKLFLDIDDDEIALLTEGKNFRQKFLHLNPDKYLLTLYLEPYILKCDGWTVSNYQLRDTYGGKIIPHARDPEKLKAPAEKSELKRRLSLPPECFLIGHIGSYRPHKGVERIIQALDLLNDPEILFLYTANKDYLPVKPYIKRIPEFPMRRLPEILGACDFAVFPLVESFISIYQLPAKIIDAMFLEVPFVVTETKSIKQVVQDEDLLIPFEVTIEQISQKIAFFKNYPQIRREKALKLKKFALSNLSVEKVSSELLQVLNK